MHRSVFLFGLGLVAAALAAAPASAQPTQPPAKKIDVVLCLDVSGSMNGLIDSAKLKLWDIVNDLAKVQPTPDLRVGLYRYGHTSYDPKRGWVRKEVDLTHDLDEIYQKLNALTINGGTELVARVTRDAVEEQKWAADKDALKIIFVCGNEPATQDKQVSLDEVAQKAKERDIIINTIYCGPAQAGKDWEQFAHKAGGKFANIDQNRGTVAIATPHDQRLAELNAKLSTTYLAYGGHKALEKQQNQLAQDANARRLGVEAEAARAASKATGLYRNEDWDLVDRLKKDPKFDLASVPDNELPENMRKMTPDERVAYVKCNGSA
jgi:uncharacterized protein YegL